MEGAIEAIEVGGGRHNRGEPFDRRLGGDPSRRANGSPEGGWRGARRLRRAPAAHGMFRQERRDAQQVVRQHGGPHEHLEPIAALERAATHAAPAQEH